MARRTHSFALVPAAALLAVLAVSPLLAATPRSDAPADFSRLVVIGDSISAGFQSGGLAETFQTRSYGVLIAGAAGVPLSIPLIGEPGIPNVLELVEIGPPPVILPSPGTSPGRLDPFAQATNLAVPGHRVGDTLTTRPDLPVDSITDLVLGLPGLFAGISKSQVEWAEALAPTTALVWIGSNDALAAALGADPAFLTDPAAFQASFAELATRLEATGATVVFANVPDVTVIPFLFSRRELAYFLGVPDSLLGLALGVGADDLVTQPALALIPPILQGQVPGPLPPSVVLTADEARQIAARVEIFNGIIAGEAERIGAGLVDVNALLRDSDANGQLVCGQRLSAGFGGGLFSLDLVHPSSTTHGIVANAFIDELNARFDAGLGSIDLCPILANDPYVLPVSTVAPPRIPGGLARFR